MNKLELKLGDLTMVIEFDMNELEILNKIIKAVEVINDEN